MHLESLAPELLVHILLSIDCPRDLWSAISAVPIWLHIFSASPERVLGAVLSNAIEPDALYHALAVFDVPRWRKGIRDEEGDAAVIRNVQEFVDRYVQSVSHQATLEGLNMRSLITVSRLYSRVSTFTDDYFARAMGALGFVGPQAQLTPTPDVAGRQFLRSPSPLSHTERARLQRAFFRYEIYSRLFPVDTSWHANSVLPAGSQFNRFLSCMKPWEVEELTSVHLYLTTVIGELMDHLEDQVVQAVRNANLSLRCDDPTLDLIRFDCSEHAEMNLFSVSGRIRSPNCLSYLASLGLSFAYKLFTGSELERKEMIRANTPMWRQYLPEALEHAPENAPATITPDLASSNDDPSHANLGYFLYKRSNRDVYLRIHAQGVLNKALRERGYVFWDAARIREPLVNDGLEHAREMSEQDVARSNRYLGLSVEERVQGVDVTPELMKRIIDEFGSTMYG